MRRRIDRQQSMFVAPDIEAMGMNRDQFERHGFVGAFFDPLSVDVIGRRGTA